MKSFDDYLTEFRSAMGFKRDFELAVHFGFSKQMISKVRRTGALSDEHCLEIARRLGVPEYEVVISRNVLKETGEVRDMWASAAKRMGGTLAIAGIMTGLSVLTADQVSTSALPEIMSVATVPQIFITGIIVLLLMKVYGRFKRALVSRLNSFFSVFSKRKETALNVVNWYVASKCFSISYIRP